MRAVEREVIRSVILAEVRDAEAASKLADAEAAGNHQTTERDPLTFSRQPANTIIPGPLVPGPPSRTDVISHATTVTPGDGPGGGPVGMLAPAFLLSGVPPSFLNAPAIQGHDGATRRGSAVVALQTHVRLQPPLGSFGPVPGPAPRLQVTAVPAAGASLKMVPCAQAEVAGAAATQDLPQLNPQAYCSRPAAVASSAFVHVPPFPSMPPPHPPLHASQDSAHRSRLQRAALITASPPHATVGAAARLLRLGSGSTVSSTSLAELPASRNASIGTMQRLRAPSPLPPLLQQAQRPTQMVTDATMPVECTVISLSALVHVPLLEQMMPTDAQTGSSGLTGGGTTTRDHSRAKTREKCSVM